MKLDIACGAAKQPGHVGIDQCELPGVDIVHDLFTFPWPIESASVDEAHCSHFLEHVPARLRPAFMNELYRILKPGAGCTFAVPYGLDRQCQDPTHEWPPIVPASFHYFNREWLRRNGLDHYREAYGIDCDFDVEPPAYIMHEAWEDKPVEECKFAATMFRNGALDLVVRVVKRGGE